MMSISGTEVSARKTDCDIIVFLALVSLLSGLLFALIFVPNPFNSGSSRYIDALMWCPAVAALLTAAIRRIDIGTFGLSRFAGKYVVLGYLMPLAYAGAAYVLVWSLGWGLFPDPSAIAKLAGLLGWKVQNAWAFVPAYFIFVATTGLIGGMARTLGEEIGWRGFLVPRMVARFGFTGGAILTGVVWALWHMPLILFGAYNNGTPFWFGFSCFAVMVVSSSVVLAWIRLRSASVWPCAIMHASHNAFIQTFFTPLTGTSGRITSYAIDEFGFAVAGAVLLLALLLWRKRGALGSGIQSSGALA